MSSNFHWILEDKLAGMELPGLEVPLIDDLLFLIGKGIHTIVSLTENPVEPDTHLARRFQWIHFPIVDFDIPDVDDALQLVKRLDEQIEQGQPVMFHCWAGIGRTGTMLAAYLIYKERQTALDIIGWLRQINRSYVQSVKQEEFLAEFYHYVMQYPET
jgi:atypical dual specificity phosphatase